MPNDAQEEYARPECWFQHADSDLELARSNDGKVLLGHRCFHAQQAAEKALKAVFVARGVDFPFIHDIDELIDTLRDGGVDVPVSLEAADALSNYAVDSRYPGIPPPKISENDRQQAIALAQSVVDWAKEEVNRIQSGGN